MAQIQRIIQRAEYNANGNVTIGAIDWDSNPVDDIVFEAGALADRIWEYYTFGRQQLVITTDDVTGDPVAFSWGTT